MEVQLFNLQKSEKRKMSKPINAYVAKFVPKDLPWYEHDGLMAWCDQYKCEDFLRDADQHFNQAKSTNFHIFSRECNGEEVPKDLLNHYQTLNDKAVSDYPETEQDTVLSSTFRTDQKDCFFEKNKT